MNIRRITPDITTNRMEETRAFYVDLFDLTVAMDMGWIVTLISKGNPTAQINILKGEPTAAQNVVGISFEVPDVDAVHAKAAAAGCDIFYPVRDEPWGVRRFHMRDPAGVVVNVMMHIETK